MRNVDYWKDELLKINGVDIALKNGVPVRCDKIECGECGFNSSVCCHSDQLVKWLYEEHVEKPTLTMKERMLCEILEDGYIARDNGGFIFHYTEKPIKKAIYWTNEFGGHRCLNDLRNLCPFKFIHWEDEEPWSIKDLLALEVKDDPVTT